MRRVYLARSYRRAVVALAPMRYYRVGEASGTVAADVMGATDGTYLNSPTLGATGLLTGDTDTAVSFAAWPEYVGASDAALPAGAAARTFGCLVNITSLAAARGLGGYGTGGGTTCAFRVQTDGSIELHNGAAVYALSAAGAVVAGSTASIFITYDGAQWITYANGSPFGSPLAQVVNTTPGGLGLVLGGSPFGDTLAGTLDEVPIWDRALAAAEIARLAQIGRGF